ncbi:MAG: efflux RND transporter periplasmic adaptor subunit [Woeseiaceae bacterium]|nr:efflux RND transporter periplasmic adaptor subunit [Woeseiaceae bacterium]
MPSNLKFLSGLLLFFLTTYVLAEAPVRVETVSSRTIVQQVNVTGSVTSPRSAVLSTAVAGLVAEIVVDEGHRVKAGDALLTLDAELAELARDRTAAEVRRSETALADARRRLVDAEKVGAERAIARTEIESLRAEVQSDEAALAASRAALREQEAIVARHTLKAPFAGVISVRHAELGEWVNRGDGLLELVATDNLRFDFRVAQEYFSALKPDTPVDIALDAAANRSLRGRIDTIVPVKDPGARTFLVRVLTDGADAREAALITPGMSVRGRMNLDTGRQGVAVTRDAILRFPDGRITVWVVDDKDERLMVREQVVETGFEFDGLVEITAGLAEGDVVVTHGNETLQDGQAVSVLSGSL